jgi:hypothetical protein
LPKNESTNAIATLPLGRAVIAGDDWSPEENWLILTSPATLLPRESYRCPTMAVPLKLCVPLPSVQTTT